MKTQLQRLADTTLDELQKLADESSSYSEVTRKLFRTKSLNVQVRSRMIELGVRVEALEQRRIKARSLNMLTAIESGRLKGAEIWHQKSLARAGERAPSVFRKNSKVPAKEARSFFHRWNRYFRWIPEYRCALCPNEGYHNGLPLVLQLDHVDGDQHNHSLENLRLLCPNCHSQTETFTSKNRVSAKEKRNPGG